MSRPNVTNFIVDGLQFARACVLDQRTASHNRGDRSWDKQYSDALESIDSIVNAHKQATKKKNRKPSASR